MRRRFADKGSSAATAIHQTAEGETASVGTPQVV